MIVIVTDDVQGPQKESGESDEGEQLTVLVKGVVRDVQSHLRPGNQICKQAPPRYGDDRNIPASLAVLAIVRIDADSCPIMLFYI